MRLYVGLLSWFYFLLQWVFLDENDNIVSNGDQQYCSKDLLN